MARCLPCIACGRELRQVFHDSDVNQPYGGTSFTSHGHYGSTAYDPMDGHFIEINVCDLCLVTHTDRVIEGRDQKPVMEAGELTGWEKVDWKTVPWSLEPQVFEHVLKVMREVYELLPYEAVEDAEV